MTSEMAKGYCANVRDAPRLYWTIALAGIFARTSACDGANVNLNIELKTGGVGIVRLHVEEMSGQFIEDFQSDLRRFGFRILANNSVYEIRVASFAMSVGIGQVWAIIGTISPIQVSKTKTSKTPKNVL